MISLLRKIEWLGLRLPDLLIQDTREYVKWFNSIYQISENKFRLVPTGADDRIFYPLEVIQPTQRKFLVLYYGTFIPNHNVPLMVDAAILLCKYDQIEFVFIGDGPERLVSFTTANQNELRNITFHDWMDKNELIKWISKADVCLGAFGNTPQSLMTVQNKIYECLAMRRPVLTGESEAIRDNFIQGKHLITCQRNPAALAEAIKKLYNEPNLLNQVANEGYNYFCSNFTVKFIGSTFSNHLSEISNIKK